MNQSNVIFGTLILAFVIFITMKGQLPGYLALFTPRELGDGSGGGGSSTGKKVKKVAVEAAKLYVFGG